MVHVKYPWNAWARRVYSFGSSRFGIFSQFLLFENSWCQTLKSQMPQNQKLFQYPVTTLKCQTLEHLGFGFQICNTHPLMRISPPSLSISSYHPLPCKNINLICFWEPMWQPALMAFMMLWGLEFAEWYSACLASARLWVCSTTSQEKKVRLVWLLGNFLSSSLSFSISVLYPWLAWNLLYSWG